MKEAKQQDGKLSMRERICFGCGHGGGGVIFNTLMGSFMLAYYTDTLLLDAAAIATMFLIARFFDGITDVVFGSLVDRMNTRWGKARPWILVSAFLMGFSVISCFWAPVNLGGTAKLVYAYITYFFAACIAFTIFNISDYALLARMTRNVDERTNASTVMMIINNIVIILIGAAVAPMVSKLGWRTTAIILGVVTFIFFLIEFLGTKERVGQVDDIQEEELPVKDALKGIAKNKYFWMLAAFETVLCILNANSQQAAIYYCNWVLKDPMYISTLLSIATIPSIIILFFIPVISKKFSKNFVMMGSAVIMAVGFLFCAFAGTSHTMALIGVALRGVGISPLWSVPMAMVGDISDYNEWKTGARSAGMCSMGMSVGSKIGMGLGSAVTGWILAFFGYNAAAKAQTAEVIGGINFSFGWLNVIMTVVLFVIAYFMNIHKVMPQIQKDLEERKAAQHK